MTIQPDETRPNAIFLPQGVNCYVAKTLANQTTFQTNAFTSYLTETNSLGVVTGMPPVNNDVATSQAMAVTTQPAAVTTQPAVATSPALRSAKPASRAAICSWSAACADRKF